MRTVRRLPVRTCATVITSGDGERDSCVARDAYPDVHSKCSALWYGLWAHECTDMRLARRGCACRAVSAEPSALRPSAAHRLRCPSNRGSFSTEYRSRARDAHVRRPRANLALLPRRLRGAISMTVIIARWAHDAGPAPARLAIVRRPETAAGRTLAPGPAGRRVAPGQLTSARRTEYIRVVWVLTGLWFLVWSLSVSAVSWHS